MKPWSCGSPAGDPPSRNAVSTSSSTAARLSALTPSIASTCVSQSQLCLTVNSAKRGRVSSIAHASSPISMQVAVASVNRPACVPSTRVSPFDAGLVS